MQTLDLEPAPTVRKSIFAHALAHHRLIEQIRDIPNHTSLQSIWI